MVKHLGFIEEHPVIYYPNTDNVKCKDISIEAQKLIDAYNSPMDRVSVGKEVVLRKNEFFWTLACFTMTRTQYEKLLTQLQNARIKKEN